MCNTHRQIFNDLLVLYKQVSLVFRELILKSNQVFCIMFSDVTLYQGAAGSEMCEGSLVRVPKARIACR